MFSKNLSLTSFLILMTFCLTFHASRVFSLPNQFSVAERERSTKFDVYDGENSLGTLHRNPSSSILTYEFFNEYNQLTIKARRKLSSLRVNFKIVNSDDALIGFIKERRNCCLSGFEIVSPKKELLGLTENNFWRTKIVLRESVTGEAIVVISRPFWEKTSHWTIQILNPALFAASDIDPHILIFLAVYQSDREKFRKDDLRLFS